MDKTEQRLCPICNGPISGSPLKKICDRQECRKAYRLNYNRNYVAVNREQLLYNTKLKFSTRSAENPRKHPCLMCGDLISTHSRYCTRCFEYHYSLRRLVDYRKKHPVRTEKCKWCDKEFYTGGTYKFCSEECAHLSMLNDRKTSPAVKRADANRALKVKKEYAEERRKRSIDHSLALMPYADRRITGRIDTTEFVDSLRLVRISGNLCVCLECGNEFVLTKEKDTGKAILNNRLKSGISPCPYCGEAVGMKHKGGELEIQKIYPNLSVKGYRPKFMNGMEIDLYDPVAKVGVEFHGIVWHSSKFNDNPSLHSLKADLAEKAGIQLVQIYESEWMQHRECVIDRLDAIFHMNMEKYHARKLTLREMNTPKLRKQAHEFLDKNHIQGSAPYNWGAGLFNGEELVGVCTFKYGTGYASGGQVSNTGRYWELNRFATKLHTTVVGGLSKCIKAFARSHASVSSIVSFADRRWTSLKRSAYSSSGFLVAGQVDPNYLYTDLDPLHQLRNKQYMRKSAIGLRAQKPGSPESKIFSWDKTEKQMSEELGFYRIYDAGKIKYEINLQ